MFAALSPAQAAALGAVQGLTEFLPVSSSAHLYVIPKLLGWTYEGVAFDVALHWGTLLALVFAFGGVWWQLARDATAGIGAARRAARSLLAKIVVASIPAAIAGVLLEKAADRWLRSLPLQAAMLALFGALLWVVDRLAPRRREDTPGWPAAIGIGVAQCLALVPGVSRSGITITAGRAATLDRVAAARFSFLLATPITFGAGLLELRHLPHDLPVVTLACGVVTSAVVGFLAIRGLLRWLSHAGLGVFAAYRLLFAAVIVIAIVRR